MFRLIIVKSNCKGSCVKFGKMPFAERVERTEFDYESKTIRLYVKG